MLLGLTMGCGLFNEGPKPEFAAGNEISTTATVVAIDYKTRHVTLKGPDGNLTEISVGEDAYNFDQVVIGDLVDITYLQSVALYLQKSTGEQPSAVTGSGMVRAPKGQKPEGVAYNVLEVKATVENIDYANRTVDIRGPYGNLKTVVVNETVKNFDNVKKGDEVIVRYTEATAITVRPAESK